MKHSLLSVPVWAVGQSGPPAKHPQDVVVSGERLALIVRGSNQDYSQALAVRRKRKSRQELFLEFGLGA